MALTATAARPHPRTSIGSAKQIAQGSSVRSALKAFAPTERLFSLGDPKTELYLVESGVVAVYEPRSEGHQAIIEFAFPGDSAKRAKIIGKFQICGSTDPLRKAPCPADSFSSACPKL